MTLDTLILTGSWSDRTAGVVDIIVAKVRTDIEHISIAAVEVIRRERPKRNLSESKQTEAKTKNATQKFLLSTYSLS